MTIFWATGTVSIFRHEEYCHATAPLKTHRVVFVAPNSICKSRVGTSLLDENLHRPQFESQRSTSSRLGFSLVVHEIEGLIIRTRIDTLMDHRKPASRRDGASDHHDGYQYPPEHSARQYYQSAPPPPQMAFYGSYPPRLPYPHPPYTGWSGMVGGDPMSSPPPEGFHPPPFDPRFDGRRNATAVTPDTHVMPPAEFMSPPSNVKKRSCTSSNSLSPSKRVCQGKLFVGSIIVAAIVGWRDWSSLRHRAGHIIFILVGSSRLSIEILT
jgi:hypothetical protein